MAMYKLVLDHAIFEDMEHVFEVPDHYTSSQRQHVMLQQKRIAAQEFKSVAFDFLRVEAAEAVEVVADGNETEPTDDHQEA